MTTTTFWKLWTAIRDRALQEDNKVYCKEDKYGIRVGFTLGDMFITQEFSPKFGTEATICYFNRSSKLYDNKIGVMYKFQANGRKKPYVERI